MVNVCIAYFDAGHINASTGVLDERQMNDISEHR